MLICPANPPMAKVPTVFISSTSGLPSLDECLKRVAKADVVVAIVAHRYGWVPNDTGQPDAKSITWLECEHAWNVTQKNVLPFVVDPKADWPATHYESYRLIERVEVNVGEELRSLTADGQAAPPPEDANYRSRSLEGMLTVSALVGRPFLAARRLSSRLLMTSWPTPKHSDMETLSIDNA